MPRPSLGKLSDRARAKTFLAEWRQFRGLNQEQAAERIGIERSSLSRLEAGRTAYSQHILEAMAAAYDCAPSDLISRDPAEAMSEPEISLFDLEVGEKDRVRAFIEGIRATKAVAKKSVSSVRRKAV